MLFPMMFDDTDGSSMAHTHCHALRFSNAHQDQNLEEPMPQTTGGQKSLHGTRAMSLRKLQQKTIFSNIFLRFLGRPIGRPQNVNNPNSFCGPAIHLMNYMEINDFQGNHFLH